jgi:hypothetical protein
MQRRALKSVACHALTMLLLCAALLASGASIHAGGYSGFIFAAAVVAALTYVLCRFYPDHPLLVGCAAATCVALSLRIDDSRLYSRVRSIQWEYVLHPTEEALFVWGYCLFASSLVAVPFYIRHRKRPNQPMQRTAPRSDA